jgi:hypothetical protein
MSRMFVGEGGARVVKCSVKKKVTLYARNPIYSSPAVQHARPPELSGPCGRAEGRLMRAR